MIRYQVAVPLLRKVRSSIAVCATLLVSGGAMLWAQRTLPEAPSSNLPAVAGIPAGSWIGSGGSSELQAAASGDVVGQQKRLTRLEAEQMALRDNPRVTVAHLIALAQHQVYRETRSGELPTFSANATAVDAKDGSRLSSNYLTSSSLFEHAGAGANFNQLITDFGRTSNLSAFSKLQEEARNADALASEEDIVIATDRAFYDALQSQALYQVAKQNVQTRQTTESQISELTKNKLKSQLDLSFAEVNLSQAKLLLLDAESNQDASMAALDEVLGLDHEVRYDLVDDAAAVQAPPPDVEQLVQTGLKQRPDLKSLSLDQQAAVKYSKAQRDQMLPSIEAAGTVGSVPVRPDQGFTSNWWGAVGVNLNIPLFNGFLYSAEAKEAKIRAQAAGEQSRALRDRAVRDIHKTWLSTNTAYQKMSVTQQMLQQADLALKLAQTRYQMGLSSIVELSQAQYQQTDAAIGNTNAKYEYRLSLASLNYEIGSTP